MKQTFLRDKWLRSVNKPLTLVFIPKNIHPWYDLVQEGAKQAIAEYQQQGMHVTLRWEAPDVADIQIHTEKIKAAITTRPDGLAIACVAPTTNTRTINDAVKAGLPVITFDTDAPESQRKTYIGHADDYQDGYDLGQFLAKQLGYTGKVGVLTGTLTAPNHAGRVNGFKAALVQHKNMEIVFSGPDRDNLEHAMDLTQMALRNHPDINGFFCCNATNPIGCARVMKNAGKAGQIHIVGMDALPETIELIQEGVIDAVKVQRQQEIGYWAVVYLVALNQGHTIPREHHIGAEFITAEDLKKM